MTRRKARTTITIPEQLLAELDRKASEQGRNRSDMVCEAVSSYFASEEDRLLAEGYIEMAEESRGMSGESEKAWPEW
ncbi:MAG: ribbon-helix-helix protein, CopG family [Thermoleophilia bacterium]|nr:ribbon-helix-helix protein, CopG family [Thermoleophilia bacterium]